MSDLDQEEKALLEAFEAGRLKAVASAAELQVKHQGYATNLLRKDVRINVRLPAKDLRGLQKRALAEGLPYQTLVASILHKYVEGRLQERK